jgi:hypothetical protein
MVAGAVPCVTLALSAQDRARIPNMALFLRLSVWRLRSWLPNIIASSLQSSFLRQLLAASKRANEADYFVCCCRRWALGGATSPSATRQVLSAAYACAFRFLRQPCDLGMAGQCWVGGQLLHWP